MAQASSTMASNNEAISVRSARINSIILGNDKAVKCDRVSECLHRESLLDALCVFYDECERESQRSNDKQVNEFVQKCKLKPQALFSNMLIVSEPIFFQWPDRPVITETEKLRVNYSDFVIKDLIGKGYFGEVHVSNVKLRSERRLLLLRNFRLLAVGEREAKPGPLCHETNSKDWHNVFPNTGRTGHYGST